ncbi:MAG: TetR/AcrR family transcriptional regulator [Anaerolineaceae bacterium]|nr:TetR/AcrR family transcriptional regulator [Anaerolineaceae bacterium]
MPLSRREQLRIETTAEIKSTARQQMAEVGAAALSLRAIARKMRMSAPALYRYFANRDALVTALIVEAYGSLGAVMAAADAEIDRKDFHGRFQATADAFRHWALAHPQDFTLIYGTPIPDYEAPREQTVEPAGNVLQQFGTILHEAAQAGKLQVSDRYRTLPTGLQKSIDELRPFLPDAVSTEVIILTMVIWSLLYGLVWGELYGHFPPGLAESGELYMLEVGTLCVRLGL